MDTGLGAGMRTHMWTSLRAEGLELMDLEDQQPGHWHWGRDENICLINSVGARGRGTAMSQDQVLTVPLTGYMMLGWVD